MSSSTKSFVRLSNATGIRRFGQQVTWTEDPDIFHIHFSGTLEADEFKKLMDCLGEWGQDKSQFFIVCDVTQLTSIASETRKFSRSQGRFLPKQAVTIIYGASFALRILTDMSLRARKAMGLPHLGEFVFVANRAEAQVEVGKRRAKLEAVNT
jgi:hypothetical protein